jgi:hypothetical protein
MALTGKDIVGGDSGPLTNRDARRVAPAGWKWALLFTVGGLACSLVMAALSDGGHQDDDLTHYQMARWSLAHPAYLLDSWGRPGFTVLYALPAQAGWLGARACSGLLTALTAWLAYLIAGRLGVRAAPLVPLLLWLQPLPFTLSYTTLTETPLALYFTLAGWLYLRGNRGLSAAVISLCACTRHEAVLWLAMWLAAMLYERRPVREWIWLCWAPVVQNAVSWAAFGEIPLLMLFDAHPSDEYGHGLWLSMLTRWPVAAGLGQLLLAVSVLPDVLRRRGALLWIGGGLAYFVAHSVIYCFGMFASGGYFRFLVPIGPVVAVAAAEALGQSWAGLRQGTTAQKPLWLALGGIIALWGAVEAEAALHRTVLVEHHLTVVLPATRALLGLLGSVTLGALVLSACPAGRWRAVAGGALPLVALVLTVGQWAVCATLPPAFRLCAPLVLDERQRTYRAAVAWLDAQHLRQQPIVAASWWLDEFLGRTRPPRGQLAGNQVADMQPGDLLLWDSREFASPRHGLSLADLRARPDFVELWHSGGGPLDDVYCAVFEKRPPPATRPVGAE